MNRKEAVILSIIFFFTVIAWIAFDIYHTHRQTTITTVQMEEVKPLTPSFDNDIINTLVGRED